MEGLGLMSFETCKGQESSELLFPEAVSLETFAYDGYCFSPLYNSICKIIIEIIRVVLLKIK